MFNWNAQPQEISKAILVFDDWLQMPQEIINLGEKDTRWHKATIECNCGSDHENIRVTDMLHLSPTIDEDPMFFYLSKGLKMMGDTYSHMYSTTYKKMEDPQLLRYSAGHGFYNLHHDAGVDLPRSFSAILYLNTLEEGGETVFPDLNITIPPVAGKLVMFPANFLFKHKANVPVSSDKYSVVTWYRYT